jgi:hypothetical protein
LRIEGSSTPTSRQEPPASSSAGSSPMYCQPASIASGTTACSPAAIAPRRSPGRVSSWADRAPRLSSLQAGVFLAGHRPATLVPAHTGGRHCSQPSTHPKKISSWVLQRSQSAPPAGPTTRLPRPRALPPFPSPPPNRHSARPRSGVFTPAGSFPGGFRTTAPMPATSSRWGRHPKPFTSADIGSV